MAEQGAVPSSSGISSTTATTKAEERKANLCLLHQEETKLFCLNDKELVCFVCQGTTEHAGHNIKPVAEVAETCKGKCKYMEDFMREKLRDFETMQEDYNLIRNHNEGKSLEDKIKSQFQVMHDFLRKKELTILAELEKDTQRKQELVNGKIKELKEDSNALLQEIGQLQVDVKDDDISVLKKYKGWKRRIACTIGKPEAIPPGTVVEPTKYLDSLQFSAWKEMLEVIQVAPFIFDLNMANRDVVVSTDCSSILNCAKYLKVNVPERFPSSLPCILGSRSFSGGPHVWEISVGSNQYWCIGVARKTDNYFWSIGCNFQQESLYMFCKKGTSNTGNISESKLTNLRSQKDLTRVRVELDCKEGKLTFYNAEDRSHIYTFVDKFGEVFPYFDLDTTNPSTLLRESLKICPLRVSVKTDYPE